jgi:hypothetical protein
MRQYYYPKTIFNVTTALEDIFNDIIVKHLDDNGSISQTISVPISFGPQDKFRMLRKEGEAGLKYYLQYPKLALTLDGFLYAANRVAGSKEVRYMVNPSISRDALESFITDLNPVPYDLTYTLRISTESMDDYSQILENILPYFNPSITLRVKEFPEINIERDLNVSIAGTTIEYLDPQGENERRYVNGTITFTVEAYMYRPIDTSKIIKSIRASFFVNSFLETSGTGTSSTSADINVLTESYLVSGFQSLSALASIPTSSYDTSGYFEGYSLDTSGTIYYSLSAANYS